MTVDEVLRDVQHVLLDFDGPVCAIYGGSSDRVVADHLRGLPGVDSGQMPVEVRETSDPLVVLRYCAGLGRHTLRRVESEFVAQEVSAVETATETPWARDAIEALVADGRTITIVSNNSAEAVIAYLDRAGLRERITGVVGRVLCNPMLMKPHPYSLLKAIEERGATPSACVMIGDSVSDIEAASAVGVPAIAYANRPTKRLRLEGSGPDVVIDSMSALIDPVHR